MIESWGSGIEKMVGECKSAGVPEPEFIYEQTGVWVVFNYKVEKQIEDKNKEKTRSITRSKTRNKTRDKIIQLIKRNPSITRQEMAKKIGITVKGVDWHIDVLRKEGKLIRSGSRIASYWQVIEDEDESRQ